MQPRQWLIGICGLIVLAILPVIGHAVRGHRADRCAFDGMKIDPVFQARVVDSSGASHRFCCLRCAEHWRDRQKTPPMELYVTDEVTGRELDSSLAFFVRSLVITTPHTGNRIHAFQSRSDAEQHAAASKGTVLHGRSRPLQLQQLTGGH